jgi:hypothetical protein
VRIRRRRWLIVAATIGALTVAAAVSIATRIPFSSDALRNRVVASLAERLDAEVELQDLTLRVYPRLHANGRGLTVRFQERKDVPPLVSIREFDVDADLVGLWRRRVARVKLEGLALNIPPKDGGDDPKNEATGSAEPASPPVSQQPDYARDLVIEQLDAPDSQLTILRRDPEKAPRVWYMHNLTLRQVGLASKMPFETLLTNAVPPGQINASGSFGPWSRRDPGATPVDGQFTFQNADLSVFSGISGILSARGRFDGTLDRLTVNGQTETPDFMVNLSGHQVPLKTTYRAIVDATNGNTTLDPVDATILDTRVVSKGGVYEVEGVKGRVVKLDVIIEDGKLEDLMRMAVSTPRPPMTGTLALTTSLTIPPGPKDVADKLELDGRFRIAGGRFTDRDVQAKINDLSRRARGRKEPVPTPARVTSDFAGRFRLDNGRLGLSTLTFDIPGAVVSLNGNYSLRRQTLDFVGDLHMDAKLSQTTTGVKSLFLRIADPIFRRNGKTVVPLKIAGTRNNPQFGLDMKRVFNR